MTDLRHARHRARIQHGLDSVADRQAVQYARVARPSVAPLPPALWIVGGQTASNYDFAIIANTSTQIDSIGANTLPDLATFSPTSEADALTLTYPDGLGIVRNSDSTKLYWVVNDARAYTYAYGFGDIYVPLRTVALETETPGVTVSAYVGYV